MQMPPRSLHLPGARSAPFGRLRQVDSIPACKRCSTCRIERPVTDFHRRARSLDGLQANCKACALVATRRWWDTQGTEAYRAYHQGWRARHPGRAAAANRRFYWRDPARSRTRVLVWRAINTDWVNAYARQWLKANGKNTEYTRRRAARRRGALHIRFSAADLVAKVAYWGNRCWICAGQPDAIDHVKPLSKGGAHVLANLRPICTPCNSHKSGTWPWPPLA
jgi:5-methylcytosine-specific restriction endonuclease McrA